MSDVKVYRVREGVEWVNGARVPADRMVRLTAAEARFDLEQARIGLLLPKAAAPRKAKAAVPEAEQEAADDGRD